MNYLVKREFHEKIEVAGNYEDLEIVRIYNKSDNAILSQTNPINFKEEIRITYDNLEYVATANKEILITLESLINKFKKHD